jgi:hypothetical protein
MLWLDQRHALKAVRAFVGDKEGHKRDCILAGLACAKQIEKSKGPKCSHSNGGDNWGKIEPSTQLNF